MLGGKQGQAGFRRLYGSPSACAIAIKTQYGCPIDLPQHFHLLRCQGGAQGGHSPGKARLMQGYDIHIPFHHNQVRGHHTFGPWRPHGRTGAVQSEQQPALGKKRCFRPVQVFRLPIPQNTPPEGDKPPLAVTDGECHTPPEQLALWPAILIYPHEPGLRHLLGGYALWGKCLHQMPTPRTGPAQPKSRYGLTRQATTEQVVQPCTPFGLIKGGGPHGLSGLQNIFQRADMGHLLTRGAGVSWHFHPCGGGQLLHRLGEVFALHLHDKGDDIPMHTTAEAMEVVIIHIERRRFFPMEGAAPFPVPPRTREFDPPPDNRRYGRAGAQFIQKIGINGHGVRMLLRALAQQGLYGGTCAAHIQRSAKLAF